MTQEIFHLEKDLPVKEKEKLIIKIQKEFIHSSAGSIKKIIRNSGHLNSDVSKIIDNVISQCEICKRYKKPPLRPIGGDAKADSFNETVPMDLHEIQPNVWYMHIIDNFSCLRNVTIKKSKTAAVRAFLQY